MPVFPLRRCQFVANLFEAVEAEAKEQTKAEAKVDNTTDSE